jgi:TPR repeat protein
MGRLHYNGRGLPQDLAAAVKWYRRAACLRHAEAQFTLGIMHINGDGVGKDYVLAHMWFSLAAAQGLEAAGEHRDITASLMRAEDLAVAQRLAREWKPSAAP